MMVSASDPAPRQPEPASWKRWVWLALLGLVVAVPAGVSWFFTASLTDDRGVPPSVRSRPEPPRETPEQIAAKPVLWPADKLDGDEAKRVLLESMRRTFARVDQVAAYTATFRRQERVGGVLGPEITSTLKVRNHPFAIYLKYLAPKAGKEVVYAEGHRENKVLAHNGDWTRRLVPRLAVAPDSPLALADSRHPVTEAGLLNLSRKLLHYRELDMGDADATTTLDRTTTTDGRDCLRSFHTHSKPDSGRPFCQVEILYDVVTQVPFQISSYDWPEPGQSGPLNLAERYTYDDLKLDAPLTAADFDPSNPDYAFMRF